MNINELIEQIGGRERLEAIVYAMGAEPCDADPILDSVTHGDIGKMARALLAVLDAQEKPSIEVEKMNVERQALIFWLKNEINLIESARDEIPFGLDADGEMALKGIRTALSALEAKPVCYTGSGSMEAIKVGCEGYIWRDCENSHPIGLYTAPPAASVPDALREAVNAIYFTGSSNYFLALWSIVRFLSPEIADLLDKDERAAFERVNANLQHAAAPAPGGDGG